MKILFSFFIILVFCSTDCGKPIQYDYSISNQSSTQIDLIPYIDGVRYISEKVTLNNGAVLKEAYKAYRPGGGGYHISYLLKTKTPGIITHIEIVFNNSKKTLFQQCTQGNDCNAQPRNPFNNSFNDGHTEVYTITPEDYASATPCNGSCY